MLQMIAEMMHLLIALGQPATADSLLGQQLYTTE